MIKIHNIVTEDQLIYADLLGTYLDSESGSNYNYRSCYHADIWHRPHNILRFTNPKSNNSRKSITYYGEVSNFSFK